MTTRLFGLPATLAVLFLYAGPLADAAILSVDFGTNAANSLVEPGFTAQTSGSAAYATSVGEITVDSSGNFFNRSANGTYTSAPLYGDFNFLNGFGTLTLTIAGDGIEALTGYEITFYSYDSQHGGGGGTVTYTAVDGTVGGTSIAYSNTFPDDNASTTIWTANASGEIVIDVTGTNEGPRISGLEIVSVIPEPASLALLGVGGLLIAGRRRRG